MKVRLFQLMWVLALAVFSGQASYCQNIKASLLHKSVEDGLSNRFVNCMHQDAHGFLWVGTNNGLNRFDGYHFDFIQKSSGGMSAVGVVGIEETFDGKLWVLESNASGPFANPTALEVMDVKNMKIIPLQSIFYETPPFSPSSVSAIESASDGSALYIGTYDGRVYRWTPTQSLAFIGNTTKDEAIKNFYLKKDGSLVAFTLTEIVTFSPRGEPKSVVPQPIPKRFLKPIGEDASGRVVFEYTNFGYPPIDDRQFVYQGGSQMPELMRFDLNLPALEYEKAIDINTLGWDPYRQHYWINLNGHWVVLDNKQNLLCDFTKDFDDLDLGPVFCTFVDRLGNTWMGTGDGIVKVDLFESFFNLLLYSKASETNSAKISTRGICRIGNLLYVNSYEGGKVIDLKTGKLVPSGFPEWSKQFGLGLFFDSRGWLWSGAESGYFMGLNPSTKEMRRMTLDSTMGNRGAAIFYELRPGKLLLGTMLGLAWYDFDKNKVSLFEQYNQFPELSKSKIRSFKTMPDGRLAIASTSGVYFMDLEKGIVERWRSFTPWSVLPCDNINDLLLTNDGTWCFAASGCGLVVWNPKTGLKKTIGLPSDIVYHMLEGKPGEVWFSTQKGLAVLDVASGEVKAVYSREDGISYDEFNSYSFFRDQEGINYFGGLNGITCFKSNYTESNRLNLNVQPSMRLSRASAVDRSSGYLVDITPSYSTGNVLVQSTSQVGFRVTFSLLCFWAPDKIMYRWRLRGLSDKWNYQEDNVLQFNNLAGGEYTLEISGRNSSGSWSEPLTVLVNIELPFYQSTWFYVVLITVLVVGAYLLVRWRVAYLERERKLLEMEVKKRTKEIYSMVEQLEEMDQVKSNFFANITHELRTPLTLVLSPIGHLLSDSKYEISDEVRVWLTKAARNGSKLNNLLNEMLELSKLESNKMTRKETPVLVEPLLRRLFMAFQTLAMSKDVGYEAKFDLPPRISANLDVSKIEKIINNLISNAIKYTQPKGSIGVKVWMEEKVLVCEICDTGIGIPAKDLDKIFDRFYQSSNNAFSGGAGIGLALSRELTIFLGGDIKVQSEPGKGSCFTLRLPLDLLAEPLSVAEAQENEEAIMAEKTETYFRRPLAPQNAPLLYIAEDQMDLQDYLWELLSPHYRLNVFSNGKQLLDHLEEKGAPDLIISDVMMPEMDGFEMVDLLKKHISWWRIPVVMLTARNDLGDRLQALRIGVDDYLAKPFDPDELLSRCYNLLTNLSRRSELETTGPEPEAEAAFPYPDEPMPEMEAANYHEWLLKVETQAKEALGRGLLSVSYLASRMFLSERQFARRLKQATGLAPKDYIREVRLQEALSMLQSGQFAQANQVAQAVGLSDWDYFVKQFKERFGKHPSNYLK